jgi:hypothetical protein
MIFDYVEESAHTYNTYTQYYHIILPSTQTHTLAHTHVLIALLIAANTIFFTQSRAQFVNDQEYGNQR